MDGLEVLLVAFALGCDAFAVGLGVGTRFCSPRQVFRLSFHFGLFQFLMPLIGWFFGQNLIGVAREWAPWAGAALLLFIGARMSYEAIRQGHESAEECPDPTRGYSLVMLSVATSIDALGVGFTLGVLGQSLFFAAIWIGIVACVMTWTAMRLGNKLSQKFGKSMGIAGGLILMAIAMKLLTAS